LTIEGFKKLVAIRASMNNGLSGQLKVAFSDVTPAERPFVPNQVIPDPN
jgi:hypothetical protein